MRVEEVKDAPRYRKPNAGWSQTLFLPVTQLQSHVNNSTLDQH